MPQVSVIIPTYNSARYVVDAVESVLAQTYRDFEVIVIDDGSTDETPEVMKRYGAPVRYLRQENAGVAAARNRGIAESSGRYVAFLDADDVWLPQKLERQINALAINYGVQACDTGYVLADTTLNPVAVKRNLRSGSTFKELLLRGTVVFIGSVICEKEILERVGGFDPALSQCADWDMWIRVSSQTEFVYIDEALVYYRQHDTNMSRSASLLELDTIRVLEKSFARTDVPSDVLQAKRSAFARNYMVLAGTYFHAGMHGDFLRCAARAVGMDIRQIGYLLKFPLRVMMRKWVKHQAA